jgi:hypothetical protein
MADDGLAEVYVNEIPEDLEDMSKKRKKLSRQRVHAEYINLFWIKEKVRFCLGTHF